VFNEAIERAGKREAIGAFFNLVNLSAAFVFHWPPIRPNLNTEARVVSYFCDAFLLIMNLIVNLRGVRNIVVLQVFELEEFQNVSNLGIMSRVDKILQLVLVFLLAQD